LNSTFKIGCSALDPEPNNVVAPALAGSATVGITTASAARLRILDLNLIPFPSKANPHYFDLNCDGRDYQDVLLFSDSVDEVWTRWASVAA
jgi:hypothetical protein